MYAIAQEDFLRAQVGDPEIYRSCNAPLVCGLRYEKSYGDLLIKPDFDKAKALLKESGYDGRPIVMLHQTDLHRPTSCRPSASSCSRRPASRSRCVSSDWQTVVSRRARKEAPDKGGWNIFYTTTTTVDADNPAVNSFTSGGCDKAWFGWPCDAEMEKLRSAFARETDPEKQKAIALAVSDRVIEQAMYVPLGQYKAFGAYRKDRVEGWLQKSRRSVVEHQQEAVGGRRSFARRSARPSLRRLRQRLLRATAARLRRRACQAHSWCGSPMPRCPRCPGRHWPAPSRRPRRRAG